jgi:hypothetical protein
MDIKNRAIDESTLDEVSGGKTIGQGYKKSYRCDACQQVFENKRDLSSHQKETGHLAWTEIHAE